MTQAYWGIELADVDNAQVYGNNVWGNSGSIGRDGRAFVQMNPGLRNGRTQHRPQQHRAASTGRWPTRPAPGHTITNNCLNEVNHLYNYSFTGPVTISGNGPC